MASVSRKPAGLIVTGLQRKTSPAVGAGDVPLCCAASVVVVVMMTVVAVLVLLGRLFHHSRLGGVGLQPARSLAEINLPRSAAALGGA
ncbi:MAG TPA: hypothetical protein VN255_02195 [Mycobacterium sp.]|nr:hypothetical protein [Mycobacterium sp.]HWT47427.1 hypothetical protein [Mycobacterium sp.]